MDWIRRLPKRPKATTKGDFAVRSLRPGWSILKMPLSDLDQQLIDRCLNHEEGSWPDFVDRYLGLVFHVVRHTAHSRSMTLSFVDVEDVAAEILLELVKNDYSALRQFKGLSSFPAYLTVISRRICIRQLIKLRRESVLGHVNAHRTVVDGSSLEIEPVLATEEVDRLLAMLEPRQAEVVRLYHLEYKSYREIAKRLGVDENSVGAMLTRARNRLQAVAKTESV